MRGKKVKKQTNNIDGLGPRDIKRLTTHIRQVWHWSHPKKLVIQRCTRDDGFAYCERCADMCPKIFVDHIEAIGPFNPRTYIERSFVPSNRLQGLCKPCHNYKTKKDLLKMKRGKKK